MRDVIGASSSTPKAEIVPTCHRSEDQSARQRWEGATSDTPLVLPSSTVPAARYPHHDL